MNRKKFKKIGFRVHVPNLAGDAVAEIVPIEVKVYIDPETGEEVLTRESIEVIENTQARLMGLLLPEQIKALRQRLGLTQREISELLQLEEKSYTRWETGRARPSRSINVLLRALRDGHINIDYLRALLQPGVRKGLQERSRKKMWRAPNAAAA